MKSPSGRLFLRTAAYGAFACLSFCAASTLLACSSDSDHALEESDAGLDVNADSERDVERDVERDALSDGSKDTSVESEVKPDVEPEVEPDVEPEVEPDADSGGGCSGQDDCGALEECGEAGYCVAKSVPMPEGFSIDAIQVTRSQYEAWLSTKPSAAGLPAFCNWKTDFRPSYEWPPGSKGNHPVVYVDWCDAYAYCQTVGKRLCGRMSGGENGFDDYADVSKSQWFVACSSQGDNDYPYGDIYDPQACNGNDQGLNTTVEVGNLSACQSMNPGYEGVYDMSGNVREWEDSCNGSIGKEDRCRLRGGSFYTDADYLRCDGGVDGSRGDRCEEIGFRCCSAP